MTTYRMKMTVLVTMTIVLVTMTQFPQTQSEGIDSNHDDPTPGPSGSGDTGSHVADPHSSSSDTDIDENVQARPKRSCIPTMASRGRARRCGAIRVQDMSVLTDLGPRLDSLPVGVVVAGPWLEDGCLFKTVAQAEILAGVIFSHQNRTLLNLLQMLAQHLV